MKLRLLTAATAALALAAPAAASAAEFTASPAKPCYGSGEVIGLAGSGFTPNGGVEVTEGGTSLGQLGVDAAGNIGGAPTLRLGLRRGRQDRVYTATDLIDSTISASMPLTVSAVDVNVKPRNGPPSRLMTINASGFTLGKTLWAHVVKGRSKRHLRIGGLKKACHVLEAKQRLLRQGAPVGVYTVQFDTFRKYKAKRVQEVQFNLVVSRVFRPAIASASWSRLF